MLTEPCVCSLFAMHNGNELQKKIHKAFCFYSNFYAVLVDREKIRVYDLNLTAVANMGS